MPRTGVSAGVQLVAGEHHKKPTAAGASSIIFHRTRSHCLALQTPPRKLTKEAAAHLASMRRPYASKRRSHSPESRELRTPSLASRRPVDAASSQPRAGTSGMADVSFDQHIRHAKDTHFHRAVLVRALHSRGSACRRHRGRTMTSRTCGHTTCPACIVLASMAR